jgi:predicted Zn-dependent protease
VDRGYATFDQTYRMEKGDLVVERTVVILKRKVPKTEWKDYNAFARDIGAESGENYISLNAHTQENAGQNTPQLATSEALARAGQEETQGDWESARKTLNNLKATDPWTPYLMSMLGGIAKHDGKPDEAIQDYEAELTNHPDAPTKIVTQLANLYLSQQRYRDEETLLRKYEDRNDDYLFSMLVNAQIRSGNDAAALTTLQGIMATHPDAPTFKECWPVCCTGHIATRKP